MGFFTMSEETRVLWITVESQSLSGWDGVFHPQSHGGLLSRKLVAIPFRVGWGFSLDALYDRMVSPNSWSQSLSGWDGVFHGRIRETRCPRPFFIGRNPFQGGMGFFTG